MARPDGVTYDAVEQAANELRGAGVGPTVRLLREKVGGSNTTVLRHLNAWKAANPPARHQAREIPIEVVAAMESALTRAEARVRSEIQAQLLEIQTTLEDMSKENEDLLQHNAALVDENAALTSERDTLKGHLAEQAVELLSARQAAAREQEAAECARVEVAKAQLRLEGADARITECQQRERDVRENLLRVQGEFEALRESRADAEQRAAVARAELNAERSACQSAQERLAALQEDVQSLTTAFGKAAAAEATATELRSTVALLEDLLKRAQDSTRPSSGEPSKVETRTPALNDAARG